MNFGRLDVEHAVSERNCNVPASRRHTWSWCQRLSTPARQAGSGSSNLPDHTVISRGDHPPCFPRQGKVSRFDLGSVRKAKITRHYPFPQGWGSGSAPAGPHNSEFPWKLERVGQSPTRKRRWRNWYTHWSQKPAPVGMWVRLPPGVQMLPVPWQGQGVSVSFGNCRQCCRCEGMGYFIGEGRKAGVQLPRPVPIGSRQHLSYRRCVGRGLLRYQPKTAAERAATGQIARLSDCRVAVEWWGSVSSFDRLVLDGELSGVSG